MYTLLILMAIGLAIGLYLVIRDWDGYHSYDEASSEFGYRIRISIIRPIGMLFVMARRPILLYVLAFLPKKSTKSPFLPASWSAIKHKVAPSDAIFPIMLIWYFNWYVHWFWYTTTIIHM